VDYVEVFVGEVEIDLGCEGFGEGFVLFVVFGYEVFVVDGDGLVVEGGYGYGCVFLCGSFLLVMDMVDGNGIGWLGSSRF